MSNEFFIVKLCHWNINIIYNLFLVRISDAIEFGRIMNTLRKDLLGKLI